MDFIAIPEAQYLRSSGLFFIPDKSGQQVNFLHTSARHCYSLVVLGVRFLHR